VPWAPDPGVGKRRQLGRIALACDQRIDYRPTTFAQEVADQRIELDVGILERLLQPLDVAHLLKRSFPMRGHVGGRFPIRSGSITRQGSDRFLSPQ
jgi:hypothetical protein